MINEKHIVMKLKLLFRDFDWSAFFQFS